MNRTEHKMRMCFEPGYSEKYERFLKERNSLIKLHVRIFFNSVLPIIVGPILIVTIRLIVDPSIAYALIPLLLILLLIPVLTISGVVFISIRKEYKSFNF